ncbi:RNA polymerase II mediator complex subunit [Orbilia blumenaviensis]|uniref:Mediator of RNA polymerase II transcription subunit 17 n=1 Tax=Orbilia blumenaviensis TaxID=1796055 RepID=A0AAV9V7R3_9PEZI
MDDRLLLSLVSWPDPDPHKTSLSSLIPRIQSERGPFKNVTEDSLNEEIAAAEKLSDQDATHDDDQVPVLAATTDDQPNPRETLALKKQELIKLIEHAQFDAMSALDFVSLLLSGVRPAHAETSMTRHLKENVGSGTLGSDSIRKKDSTEAEKADSETISKGWRSESLVQSASSLLSAASRLAQESERERMYWEDVLDVKKDGWAICRVPREPQSLGVRFGFSEAGAEEKYRGLGVLRKGTDGAITMQDLGHGNLNRSSVRVQVSRKGQVTGASKPFADDTLASGITSMIQNSRNYAYEHELFLEIAREARTLANLGFRNVDEAVTFELGADSAVIIDMTSNADISALETTCDEDNELAQGLSTALHLLLSHAHRQNLKRRRLPPPLLTQRPTPNPPLYLLRPIVSHLRHQSNTNEFKSSASSLISYAKSAGLNASLTLEKCHNCLSRDIRDVDAAVDSLLGLLESKATVRFPGSWKATVLVQTLLAPSIFGTRFVVHTAHDGSCATLMGTNSFSSQAEVQRYLQWCLERSVINYISSRITTWEQIAMSNEMTQVGEQSQYKRLRVEVENEHLAVRWTVGGGEDENHRWTGEEGALSLEALIRSI